MAARDPTSAAYRSCQGCGAWSQGRYCPNCGWSETDATIAHRGSSPQNPFPLRILVDLILDHEGRMRVGQVFSHRLRWLASQTSWLTPLEQPQPAGDPELNGLLSLLAEAVQTRQPRRFGPAAWKLLRNHSTALAQARVAEHSVDWQRHAATSHRHQTPRPEVELSLRLAIHVPHFEQPSDPTPGVKLTGFSQAMDLTGRQLEPSELRTDFSRLVLSPDCRMAHPALQLRSERDLLLTSISLCTSSEPLLSPGLQPRTQAVTTIPAQPEPIHRFCAAGETCQLTLPRLTSRQLRALAQHRQNGAQIGVQLTLQGSATPIIAALPESAIRSLPPPNAQVDIFLDIGSTQTKYALYAAHQGTMAYNFRDTTKAMAQLMLGPYHKETFIHQPAEFHRWLTDALPALASTIHAEHGAYVRNVRLALPSRHVQGSKQLLTLAQELSQRWLVGRLCIDPEHLLLAHRYISIVGALQAAATSYRDTFDTRQRAIVQAQTQATQVNEQRDAYHNQGFWKRLWTRSPSAWAQVEIPEALPAPQAWMVRLLQHPGFLDRYLLLDAGGYSLDVSMVQQGQIIENTSRSWHQVGGEQLSIALGELDRLGDREGSRRATNLKAQLGQSYLRAPRAALDDSRIKRYRDSTHALYAPALDATFSACAERWRQHPFLVLLVGGGSLNPFLPDAIRSRLGDGTLSATLLTPGDLLASIQAGGVLGITQNNPVLRHFTSTYAWADDKLQRELNYDPYCLVAAMCGSEA